jgi:polysaccharide biosynthesis transport protein
MEIKKYLMLVQKWLWLILLGLVLGSGIGIVASFFQKPVYQASTKILVTRNRQESSFDSAYLTDQQLVQTYIELLSTQPVVIAASQKVGFTIDPKTQLSVAQVNGTQIIQITVKNSDPDKAVQAADTLVQVLAEQSESLQAGRYAAMESSLNTQIQQVEDQIMTLRTQFDKISQQEIQDQIANVDKQIQTLEDERAVIQKDVAPLITSKLPEQQAELTDKQARLSQIDNQLLNYQQIHTNLVFLGKPSTSSDPRQDSRLLQLQATLNLYQQLYTTSLNNLESVRLSRLQYTPNITPVEYAAITTKPSKIVPLLYAALAGIVGVFLAVTASILIEYMDDTIKSPGDVTHILSLPTLASIPEFPLPGGKSNEIFILGNPKSLVTDAFRLLRTGIIYNNKGKSTKTLLIVSPEPDDGRTSIALNLAASLSLLGYRVTVVDANIRSPKLHVTLGVDNKVGLSDVLSDNVDVTGATHLLQGQKNINALTGGNIPDSPTELLESDRLSQVLAKLTAKVDMVILDGPPVFVADALAFASRVDGILLVIRPGYTRSETARAALEYLQRSGGNIIGVVLSRVPRNWAKYHEGFYFNSENLAKPKK